ncbi:MAG: hypothetical protein WC222_04500 [Parachlamydiales bacterium]|jgi:hypothetical protein
MPQNKNPPKTTSEEEKVYLLKIKEYLATTGLPVEIAENESGAAIIMPLAPTGPTAEAPLMIQIKKQVVANLDLESGQESPTMISAIFMVHLPFTVKASALADTVLLMNFINSTFPVTGFDVEMGELKPKFKYTLLNSVDHIDKTVILSVVGIIMYAMDLFLTHIRNVAEGKSKFQDTIQQLIPPQEG